MSRLADLQGYLEVLSADADAGQLLEVRFRTERGMGQRFFAAAELERAAEAIARLGAGRDTYVGVLLRDERRGGAAAVSVARLVWVEVDAAAAATRLARAPQPPTMVLASGTPGHLHAYWRLSEPVPVRAAEAANRRLALAVGGDMACVDPARILRPPLTLNFKTAPPRPVELVALERERRWTLAALVDGLAEPRPPATAQAAAGRGPQAPVRPRARPLDMATDARLRAIPAAEYVARLSGRRPNREGKVLCPFHVEQTPSLQTYPDGSWCCFGCGRGGSIVDFAAAAWGMGTKGRDFLAIRERLAAEFLTRPVIAPARPYRRAVQSNPITEEVTR